MEESDFTANWIRPSVSMPKSGTRCLVTDGDVVIIATYIAENGTAIWVFSGLLDEKSNTFDVQGWMPTPKPIKKLVSYEDNTIAAEDKVSS